MIKHVFQPLLFSCLILFGFSACKKEDIRSFSPPSPEQPTALADPARKATFSGEVATSWMDLELELIKSTPGFTPPVASRALGYTGVTLYESLVKGMGNYNSLAFKLGYSYTLPTLQEGATYHWPAVANAAMKTIVSHLFAHADTKSKTAIDNLYKQWRQGYKDQITAGDMWRSEEYGKEVAQLIFAWSKTDGGHEGYLNNTPLYTFPLFPGAWVPTAPAFQSTPVQAYWGNNRPFLSSNVDKECLPPAPPFAFSTSKQSDFYKQAKEVYEVSLKLNKKEIDIAMFWADGANTITPPGHNMNIATQLIRSKNLSLAEAAIVYAKMGMAVADAFIACWKGKYQYNLMRPITYIQQNIDPSWKSLLATPPFPSYCSGHATVSGASAEVLTSVFGDKVKFTDNTHVQTFGAKKYKSFYEAADEASVSRLYGGIHFKMDNEIGLEKGKLIGKNIARLRLKK